MSAIATAIIASAVIVGGVSYYEGEKSRTQIQKAQDDATARNDKALADAKAAQDAASEQAQAQILDKRRKIAASNTVFTDPMGLGSQAASAKKTILGA